MLYPEQVLHEAARLLQAVQKGFAGAGVPLPDRQFLYPGPQPPADFDAQDAVEPGFLAVGIGPLSPGAAGAVNAMPVYPQMTRRSLQLRVWLFRAVHTVTSQGDLPTPDDLTADAERGFVDAAVLTSALEQARTEHSITGTNVGFAISPLTPVTTLGGYAGQTATIDLDLLDGTR